MVNELDHELRPDPISVGRGRDGALLIHGFTGAPPEMRPLATALAAHGMCVEVPLLPGHGTTPDDLNRHTADDWTAAVAQAYAALAGRCERVVVGGLSMGAVLALELAAGRPAGLAAVLAFSPAVRLRSRTIALTPLLKHLARTVPKPSRSDLVDPTAHERIWAYPVRPLAAAAELYALQRRVRRRLPAVSAPLLVVQSSRDAVIHPDCGTILVSECDSAVVELHQVERSGHNLLVDAEGEAIVAHAVRFVDAWLRAAGERR